jgi:Antitoxin Phd_YefM, type II toxin-antitoxin system
LFDVTEIGIHKAKRNLSKLIERTEGSEEIVITRRGEQRCDFVSERFDELPTIPRSHSGMCHWPSF